MPVQQSRHKDLNDYISNAVQDVRDWISKGLRVKGVDSGGSYPQALQVAKQWSRFGGDVRHTHWAM